MSFDLDLRPSVFADLKKACAWYEEQHTGLGLELAAVFRATLPTIRRNPEIFAPFHRDFRHCLIARFPYAIHFRIIGKTIVVYRIVHTARSPRVLQRSLKNLDP